MNNRPWSLNIYALILVGIAISIPLQAGILQDFTEFYRYLTSLNVLVMVLCVGSAWAVYTAHFSVRILIPLTLLAVTLNNWWVGTVGLDFSISQTSLATCFFFSFQGLLLEPRARKILGNPDLKWWRRSTRSQVAIPVAIFPWTGEHFLTTKSFDLSDTGVFVQGVHDDLFGHLSVGDKFQMRLSLSEGTDIICSGELVRKTESRGIYPSGIGIKFQELDSRDRRALKKFNEALM